MITAPTNETLAQFKRRVIRSFILRRLKQHHWNVKATAESLDTPRSNLYKMIDSYGIILLGKNRS